MAKKKIVWADKAKNTLFEILQFYSDRNGNDKYSLKLYGRIKSNITLVSRLNFIGKLTDKKNIRFIIVSDYQIFYEVKKQSIEVLIIWDCRQDPEKFPDR